MTQVRVPFDFHAFATELLSRKIILFSNFENIKFESFIDVSLV